MEAYLELPDIPLEEFSFLSCDEFVGFDDKIYEKICKTSFVKINLYLKNKYPFIKNQHKYEEILIYKYNYENDELEILCNESYNSDFHCKINLYEKDMTFEIVNLFTLLENINKINHRYYPMITIINNLYSKGSGHAMTLIFDKFTKTVHLLDSNNQYCKNNKITNLFTSVFNNIDYVYIPSSTTEFMKTLNKKNNEINQQEYFKGYCMAYSIILTELFLNSNE